jgi:quinol monooxygenase YgiN
MRFTTAVSFLGTLVAASMSPTARAQPPSAPTDPSVFAVAYVEVRASAAGPARAALAQYRDALSKGGTARVEIFEQIDRPGHLAIVEKWHDQSAFDARDAGARKKLVDALDPIRVSGYDERPYKTLSTAAEVGAKAGRTVYVIAHVDVAPNPQTPALLARLAEESRKDAGNLRFDVVQHAMRSNHFTVIERWRDQAALDAHVAAAHTRQYRDELQPMTGSPLDERAYKAVE